MISALSAAWAAFRGSRIYQYAAAAGAFLLAVLLFWTKAKRAGRQEVERDAMEEAFNREARRRERDADPEPGAAHRLRDKWSRD